MHSLTPAQLAEWLADPSRSKPVILDVREVGEWQYVALPDSVHIPLGELTERAPELDSSQTVVCLCHHGVRSQRAAAILEQQGFTDIHNLSGGIDAWARTVDPNMPVY